MVSVFNMKLKSYESGSGSEKVYADIRVRCSDDDSITVETVFRFADLGNKSRFEQALGKPEKEKPFQILYEHKKKLDYAEQDTCQGGWLNQQVESEMSYYGKMLKIKFNEIKQGNP